MILRQKVSVTRKQKTGTSATGAPIMGDVVIIPLLKCDIQTDRQRANLAMAQAGQTSIKYRVMYCKLADIKAKDVITDLATGNTYKVTDDPDFNILKHMEIRMEGGVV